MKYKCQSLNLHENQKNNNQDFLPLWGIAVNLRKSLRKIKPAHSRCEEAASRRGNLIPEADIITLVAIGRRLPRHYVHRNDLLGFSSA